MTRIALALALAGALGAALWRGAIWLREDAVRDFMREAALAAAERQRADGATRDRITQEVENESIDDLRERAVRSGMFSDDSGP